MAIFRPVIIGKKKVLEDAETKETGENGKKSKNENKNLTNLAQVSCIPYLITFPKQFVLTLLNSRN